MMIRLGGIPDAVWVFWRREKSLTSDGIRLAKRVYATLNIEKAH
jgi:hypothetical protein